MRAWSSGLLSSFVLAGMIMLADLLLVAGLAVAAGEETERGRGRFAADRATPTINRAARFLFFRGSLRANERYFLSQVVVAIVRARVYRSEMLAAVFCFGCWFLLPSARKKERAYRYDTLAREKTLLRVFQTTYTD